MQTQALPGEPADRCDWPQACIEWMLRKVERPIWTIWHWRDRFSSNRDLVLVHATARRHVSPLCGHRA
jgi:hypothetical protein